MEQKKEFIPNGDEEKEDLAWKRGGELRPSKDGKGWWFTPRGPAKPGDPIKTQTTFFGASGKGAKKPDAEANTSAKADPEFVEVAKSAGLSAADAVKLTKLFR